MILIFFSPQHVNRNVSANIKKIKVQMLMFPGHEPRTRPWYQRRLLT